MLYQRGLYESLVCTYIADCTHVVGDILGQYEVELVVVVYYKVVLVKSQYVSVTVDIVYTSVFCSDI